MNFFKIKTIRSKFLVPMLLLNLLALGILGGLGYRFGTDLIKTRSERMFRARIDTVSSSIESELSTRLAKINQLVKNPVFVKLGESRQLQNAANDEIVNFQRKTGFYPGELEGQFPLIEYIGLDGFMKLGVHFGKPFDRDFISGKKTGSGWLDNAGFEIAKSGRTYVGRPRIVKSFQENEEELIPIAIPHKVGNSIRGVFAVATPPDFILRAIANIRSANTLLIILDGKKDKIVTRGDEKLAHRLPENFFEYIHNTPADKITQVGENLAMHNEISSAGWCILMLGDKHAIYSGVYNFRNKVIIIILISMTAMAIIMFLIIGKLTAPVINLTKASDRIAAGELGLVIKRESGDEIGKLTDSFNHMSRVTKEMTERLELQNLRLSRMNFSRKQLLSIISHELRTPLNLIVNFYDLLVEEMPEKGRPDNPKEFAELFESLGESIERCKILIERLTRASSIISAEIRSDSEALESSNLIESLPAICENMQHQAKTKNIVIEYPKSVSMNVACPAGAVHLVVEEALSNAVKYSADGGKIIVTASEEGAFASIVVRDFGPGIPKEYVEDVIEPFFKIENSTSSPDDQSIKRRGGLGLGLTLIVSVLRQYRGRLKIDSSKDGGAAIKLILPLVK